MLKKMLGMMIFSSFLVLGSVTFAVAQTTTPTAPDTGVGGDSTVMLVLLASGIVALIGGSVYAGRKLWAE